MKFSSIPRWGLLLWCGVLSALPLHAQEKADLQPAEPTAEPDEPATKSLPWLASLAAGGRRALAERRPVLVRVGAVWCPSCRALEVEIDDPAVQAELGRWVPVYLDADRATNDTAALQVAAIPALRIRTATGRLVASHDGLLPADDLVAWLQKHYEAALAAPDDVLLASGRPDALAVVQLVRQFTVREAPVREAAIRRLLPYPDIARSTVVKAFRDGSLATRLAALEVLRHWDAPVEGLDPWQPDTITEQLLADLDDWTPPSNPENGAETDPTKLSEEQLLSARQQIDRMLRVAPAEAEAIQQRLARLAEALLPELVARLNEATTDDDRQRLLTLRYRLVASDSLALRWPGGLVRLAASDSRQRARAAEELAGLAVAWDQPLLLELFSDPDPLVREISLRGLQQLGGKRSTDALVKLLDDPSPNVRAAVLNQLAETPSPAMVPKVADYLKKEKDADLVVHAIRFLRVAGGTEATKALVSVLKHESWQVRAEAAEAIGKASGGSFRAFSSPYGGDDNAEAAALMADAYAALIELLDDPDAFVVSRAVTALSGADMVVAVEPLVRAAEKHPNLASNIIEILSKGKNMRPKALPHLRKFTTHDDAAIRAAAIEGLCGLAPHAMQKEMVAALQDVDSQVRIAAAGALFNVLETDRRSAVSQMQDDRRAILRSISGVPDPFGEPPRSPSLMSKAMQFLFGPQDEPAPDPAEPAEEGPTDPAANDGAIDESPADEPPADEEAADEEAADEEAADEEAADEEAADEEAADEEAADEEAADEEPADEEAADEETQPDETEPPPVHPWDEWLAAYYEGKGRPEWTTDTIEPLKTMLEAESAEEQMAAARALVPLGMARIALPLLRTLPDSHPELFSQATEVLPWLIGDERLKLFAELRALSAKNEESQDFNVLISAVSEVSDRRMADTFWELLAEEELTLQRAQALQQGLRSAYLKGNHYSYSPSQATPAERRELAAAAKPRAVDGSEFQRLVALVLLMSAAPDEAAEVARQLTDDAQLSDQLRSDALQVLLLSQTGSVEANRLAIAALDTDGDARRKLALMFLAGNRNQLAYLRGTFYLSQGSGWPSTSSPNGQPIIPEPPLGLEADNVRPLIDDSDPQVAAQAGYLLALFEEPAGLDPLLRYWRSQEEENEQLDRLVYRAIAILDDSSHLAELREIYDRTDKYDVDDFYWTIRIMSGPEVLRFRGQIREDVGMEKLR